MVCEEENKLEGYVALANIRLVTADLFKKVTQRDSPVCKSMKKSATEEEVVIEKFDWKKA